VKESVFGTGRSVDFDGVELFGDILVGDMQVIWGDVAGYMEVLVVEVGGKW
jgi:hypothetical protein